jgi:hypothetical protein
MYMYIYMVCMKYKWISGLHLSSIFTVSQYVYADILPYKNKWKKLNPNTSDPSFLHLYKFFSIFGIFMVTIV